MSCFIKSFIQIYFWQTIHETDNGQTVYSFRAIVAL